MLGSESSGGHPNTLVVVISAPVTLFVLSGGISLSILRGLESLDSSV